MLFKWNEAGDKKPVTKTRSLRNVTRGKKKNKCHSAIEICKIGERLTLLYAPESYLRAKFKFRDLNCGRPIAGRAIDFSLCSITTGIHASPKYLPLGSAVRLLFCRHLLRIDIERIPTSRVWRDESNTTPITGA